MTKLTFLGGAKTVTGAKYLLETEKTRLLVDCGLEQGSDYCDDCNLDPFSFDPSSLDAVLITHAHIDHIGQLPKLVADGFHGTIYSTAPTRDLAPALLEDSAGIMQEEAESEKRDPLYHLQDVQNTLKLWKTVEYRKALRIGPWSVEFFDAGHILGSAFFVLSNAEGKRFVFSGDLGNPSNPLLKETEALERADYLVLESAYGGRFHESNENRKDLLEDVIEETAQRGGTLLIPAFATERTQELLYDLEELAEHGRIPKIPVYVDSPLAIKLTSVYKKYVKDPAYFSETATNSQDPAIFDFPGLALVESSAESKKISEERRPKIIIAGSGMSQGGRILHHEKRCLSDPKNTILFVGYQAKGSRGRQIQEGAEFVEIFGEQIPIRCEKRVLDGYSAHADQAGLVSWVRPMRLHLQQVFLVQGEEDQMQALAIKLRDEFALRVSLPSKGESFEI